MALGEAIGPLLTVFISSQMAAKSMFMVSAGTGVAAAIGVLIILRNKQEKVSAAKNAQAALDTAIN